MKSRSLIAVLTLISVCAVGAKLSVASCTQTGFIRDFINLTAAEINPTGTVTGTIDATGCNIGVYFDNNLVGQGTIDQANIFGANYFGVIVNGDAGIVAVDITNSSIHDIGEVPFNGTQHGVAIYYRAFYLNGSASGTISGNTITNYQKGGIVTNGLGTSATISGNTVTGQGPIDYIAQNGIQVGYGASASVMRNTVTGNSYTGTNDASSGGIISVGGAGYGTCADGNDCPYTVGTRIVQNTATGNDVGVWLSNLDANYYSPESATNIKVVNNIISDTALTNTTGNGSIPYQAGVSDMGNNDKIINNSISGAGYDPNTLPGSTFSIDAGTSFANRPKVHANSFDGVKTN